MDIDTPTIVSRHATSEGVVVWSRCPCGHLQMVLVPYGGDATGLTASGHDVTCPVCRPGAIVGPSALVERAARDLDAAARCINAG